MEKVKLAIIYYSMTGTNYQLARWAEEAAREAGAEVRVLKVKELAPTEAVNANPVWKKLTEDTMDVPEAASEDLVWADAVLFSSPTRFGNVTSQIKNFMDLQGRIWAEGKLVNKVVSAMASAQNSHGGQEQTILAIYTTMMHWGAIIVPTGYTDPSIFKAGGNPYGTSVTAGTDGMVEDVEDAVRHQARRLVEIASMIKSCSGR